MRYLLALLLALPFAARAQTSPTTRFNSVAEMVAANVTSPTTFRSALLGGYFAANDGGGGTFYLTPNTTSTNTGTKIASATVGYSWSREYSGAINVRWFGAKGDAANDDTTAIQNCLDIGNRIYIPAGEYKITSALSLKSTGTTLYGDGRASIIRQVTAGANAIGNTTATRYFNVSLENFMLLSGFNVDTGIGIDFLHIDTSSIRNVKISPSGVGGFITGIRLGSTAAVGGGFHNHIYNVDVTPKVSATAVGILATGNAAGYGPNSTAIYGGYITVNAGIGLQVTNTSNFAAYGVAFEGLQSTCVDLDGTGHTISGCRMETGGANTGILLRTASRKCVTIGNYLDGALSSKVNNLGQGHDIIEPMADNVSRARLGFLGMNVDATSILEITGTPAVGKQALELYPTFSDATATPISIGHSPGWTPTVDSAFDFEAIRNAPAFNGTKNAGIFYGLKNVMAARHTAGTLNSMVGDWQELQFIGVGGVTSASYSYYAANPSTAGHSPTRNYGLYIASQTAGSLENYGIYNLSGSNYFSGKIGIGDASPVAALTVGAGDLFQVADTGIQTIKANVVASTPVLKLDGTWFTGGTSTTTKPTLLIEPAGTSSTVWSTLGTGLGVNATASFAGNLADFQTGGSSKVTIHAGGRIATESALSHITSSTFCQYSVGLTGAVISRNVADANVATIIKQTHASSTGDILQCQNSAATVIKVTQTGNFVTAKGRKIQRNAQAGAYTILLTDHYVVSTSTSTKTLPSATSAGAGAIIIIKSASTFTTTVARFAGDTIDAAAADDSLTSLQNATYVSDGVTNWEKI